MWGAPVVLLWAGVLVAVAALAPVVQLVLRAGSDGWDQALRIIVRPRTAHLLGNTVVLAQRTPSRPKRAELMARAEVVQERWGLPATKWLRVFKPVVA